MQESPFLNKIQRGIEQREIPSKIFCLCSPNSHRGCATRKQALESIQDIDRLTKLSTAVKTPSLEAFLQTLNASEE